MTEDTNALLKMERTRSPKSDLLPQSSPPAPLDPARFPLRQVGQHGFRFIDLFAGIGGFRSAMTALGGSCVFTSEWDKFAAATYKAWYQDDHVYTEDINLKNADEIPDHEILCAGFPCQPFSLAGVSKKNALGREHGFKDPKQGNLFFTIMKIVDAKRPPILFLENVKNLQSHDGGRTWQVILTELQSRNYEVFSQIIDARHWVPQHRERIFIVCFDKRVFGPRSGIPFSFPPLPTTEPPILGAILEKRPDKKYMLTQALWDYLVAYREKHEKKGNGFGYSLFGAKDIARTISQRYYKDGSEILIRQTGWKIPRRLTPREAKYLMGFEDRFSQLFGHPAGFPQVVSDTQSYRQFGNAVVPLVVEAVGSQIMKVIDWASTSSEHTRVKRN
jgi:DNA (cytosine-5)-methyltransferase 1